MAAELGATLLRCGFHPKTLGQFGAANPWELGPEATPLRIAVEATDPGLAQRLIAMASDHQPNLAIAGIAQQHKRFDIISGEQVQRPPTYAELVADGASSDVLEQWARVHPYQVQEYETRRTGERITEYQQQADKLYQRRNSTYEEQQREMQAQQALLDASREAARQQLFAQYRAKNPNQW
jgi:hypothetical protein